MTFNFESAGEVRITMEGFVRELLEDCKKILGVAPTPGKSELFPVKPDTSDPLLTTSAREYFHSITAKLLYLSKRARPDILTPVAFLTNSEPIRQLSTAKLAEKPEKSDQKTKAVLFNVWFCRTCFHFLVQANQTKQIQKQHTF